MTEPVTAWVHCPKPTTGRIADLGAEVTGNCSFAGVENETETVHHCAAWLRCCNTDADAKVCGDPLWILLPEADPIQMALYGFALVVLLWLWRTG